MAIILFTPNPTGKAQARPMSAAQINALLQAGSGYFPHCHDMRITCQNRIKSCQRNEEARQKWRANCLVPYRNRYEDCIRNARPNLNSGYGEAYRRQVGETMCKHLANYRETQCKLDKTDCGTIGRCLQTYNGCVAESTNIAFEQEQQELLAREEERRVQEARLSSRAPAYEAPSRQATSNSNRGSGGVNMERAAASMARTQANQAARAQRRERAFQYAHHGRVKGLEVLLDEGLVAGFSDKDDNTLLHAAVVPAPSVSRGNIAMVERLLELGVDANRHNQARETPLSLALDRRIKTKDYAKSDRLAKTSPFKNRVLNALINASKKIPEDRREGGLTLLHVAALEYDAVLIQKLIARKFPTDLTDDRGRTAYDIAVAKSDALAALFPEHAKKGGEAGAAAVNRAAECSDLQLVPEDQHPRYRALAARGVLKLCEPSS
ncbi:MAG: hypothetical protein AAGL10_03855 [Pseudomonadota bacterium]